MSDKRENAVPQSDTKASPEADDKPHKVDETVQEEAAEERSENEGYN